MSGVEILAIAASIVQIADLGARLSVSLFTFCRKVKYADKNIDSISQDIAGTGAILQLLGHELKKDESFRLCSPQAIVQTGALIDDCHKIFKELNDAIEGNSRGVGASKLIMGLKQRLKYPFLEAQIDLLKAKLERLKSDLMVMLNVLIYGGQLRNHEALPVLKDQQDLLKQLINERLASQKQLDHVMKRLDQLVVSSDSNSVSTVSGQTISTISTGDTLVNSDKCGQEPKQPPTPEYYPSSLPLCLHDRAEEVFDHCRLINAVIHEINHVQYRLNAGIRYRAQEKILQSHYDEWSTEWKHHEDDVRLRYDYFEKHPLLKKHWKTKDLEYMQTHSQWTPSDYGAFMRSTSATSTEILRQGQSMPVKSPPPTTPAILGMSKPLPSQMQANLATHEQQQMVIEELQRHDQAMVSFPAPSPVEQDDGAYSHRPSGRISKAKKGKRVHACEFPGCGKVFTRAEHKRRHEMNHVPEKLFPCTRPGCAKAFHRIDLLQRHHERHDLDSIADAVFSGPVAQQAEGLAAEEAGPVTRCPVMMSPSVDGSALRSSSGGLSIGSLVHPHQDYRYNLGAPSFNGFVGRPMHSVPAFNSSDNSLFYTPERCQNPVSGYIYQNSILSSSSVAAFDPNAAASISGNIPGTWVVPGTSVPSSGPPSILPSTMLEEGRSLPRFEIGGGVEGILEQKTVPLAPSRENSSSKRGPESLEMGNEATLENSAPHQKKLQSPMPNGKMSRRHSYRAESIVNEKSHHNPSSTTPLATVIKDDWGRETAMPDLALVEDLLQDLVLQYTTITNDELQQSLKMQEMVV